MTASTATPAAPGMDRRAFARQMLRDVGLPLAAYYVLHALGASNLVALLAGTVLSATLLLIEIARSRRIDLFAGVILAGFALGLALTFISGDDRFMIAKDSIGSGLIGCGFLGSLALGKPLIYVAARRGLASSNPTALAAFDERYRTRPAMRRSLRILTILWGVGLLTEAVVRVVLAYQLPIATMVWLSTVLMIATIGGLIGVTVLLVRRWRAAADAR
ncbi:VC0807 family protein [Nocardia sp. NPDC003482]